MPRALPGSHAGYETQRQAYDQSPDVKRREFVHQRAMELAGDARGRAGAVKAAQARRQAEQEYEKELELERVGAAAAVEPPSPGMGRPPPREGVTEVTFGDDETVAQARAAQVAAGQRAPQYAPRRFHTTQARDERAAFSVQKGVPYAPGFLEGQAQRLEERQADLAGVEAAEQQADERTLGAQAAAQERAEAVRRDFEMRERGRLDELERREQQLQAMSEELKSEQIEDPTIFTGSTGENILRGIGALLIGAAAGASGDPMGGVDRIREMAMDNVRKQREQYERSKDDLSAKMTLYGRARERFGDERAADQAALIAAMQMVDQEVERYAALTKSPATAERARLVREELADQARLQLEEMRRGTEDTVAEQWRHVPSQTFATGGPPSLEAQVKQAKLQKELRDLQGGAVDESDPLFVPGFGKARTKEGAKQLRDIRIANAQIEKQMKELEGLRRSGWTKVGVAGVGSSEYKDAVATLDRMRPALAVIAASGYAPTETNEAQAAVMEPDPTKILGDDFEARAAAIRRGAKAAEQGAAEQNIVGYEELKLRRVR